MDHLRAGDGQTATCGHGDGRLRVGLSAGSSGPWMTAASSWRSESASTVSRRTGSSTAGGARFGHNAVLRAFVAVACGCATWLHVVRIRVGGVQENGIQHGRRRSDGHVRRGNASAFRVRVSCPRPVRVSSVRSRFFAGNFSPRVGVGVAPGQIHTRLHRRGVGGVHSEYNDG